MKMARQVHPISAATFREPVIRALGTLSNLRANAPVSRKDVMTAVLAETGYAIGQFGDNASGKDYVTWAIGRAYFLMKRDERLAPDKMKRGMWGLSDTGIKVAATLLGATAPVVAPVAIATTVASMADVDPATLVTPEPTDETPEVPAATPAPEVTAEPLAAAPAPAVKPKSKGAKRTKVPASDEAGGGVAFMVSLDGTDTYNADPYIRSLAIQSTSCFGQFSTRSPVCGDCPLSVACKSKMVATMSSLAGTLRQRDTDAIVKAKAEADRKVARAAQAEVDESTMLPGTKAVEGLVTDETIDDIMDELESGNTPLTAKASPAPAPAVPAGGEIIEAVVPTICAKCNSTIATGEKCVWLAGQGVYHSPSCP